MTNLGIRVKQLRKQKGWSQLRLAEIAGVSKTAIGDIETGVKTRLTKKQRIGISKALGVTIEELLLLEAR